MLYELIEGVRTLSVIGMCKNAGKTTVLNSLITECEQRGEILGLTSIGRDGERSDLVTNTKKPEIFVREGAVIATAEGLLGQSDISREILAATGVPTPMGEIVIVRARSSGYVQIGGASITEHQKGIRDMLFEFGCDRVFIDGAISRKSLGNPALADGVILSSGASYDPDIRKTVGDTAYIAELFSLKTCGDLTPGAGRYTLQADGETLSSDDFSEIASALRRAQGEGGASSSGTVFLRGAVTDNSAKELLNCGRLLKNVLLVAEDASRLLLKPAWYEKLMRFSRGFRVMNGTRLAAVTVNPFSAYGTHYGKDEFYRAVKDMFERNGICAPVMDVKNV